LPRQMRKARSEILIWFSAFGQHNISGCQS
jgi:hypothetical protein